MRHTCVGASVRKEGHTTVQSKSSGLGSQWENRNISRAEKESPMNTTTAIGSVIGLGLGGLLVAAVLTIAGIMSPAVGLVVAVAAGTLLIGGAGMAIANAIRPS